MGKYKHEGIGRNISIAGGKERADLFKDMSGGYNAMGDSNDPSPLYNYGGNSVAKRYSKGPLELTAEGKKKILASDANPEFKSAIAKQPVEMKRSPMHQGVHSKAPDPRGSMKGLNKKTALKRPEPKQPTININERTLHPIAKQPRQNFEQMEKLREHPKPANLATNRLKTPLYKSGCTSGGSSKSPYKQMGDPNKKMDRLSARHKSLYDRFEMGQTSEAEEQRMYRLEDRMDKVGKKIKKNKSKNK